MLAIELRFLSGQFHATPWDHQVNEGIVEWPPSPWRLLRALIATWHLKARDDVHEATLLTIVNKLGAELPRYRLPPMIEMHTRHFMPLFDLDKDSAKPQTTKVFQAFARLEPADPIVVTWPNVDLNTDERAALGVLLARLGFLGRAESWVEGRVSDVVAHDNCVPADDSDGIGDLVRVLTPVSPDDFPDWRRTAVDVVAARALREQQVKDSKKGKMTTTLTQEQAEAVEAAVPATLFEALKCETDKLQKAGWSDAPGTRLVDYVRTIADHGMTQRRARAATTLPTVARYALASAVPPQLTDAISEAAKVHQALVKRSDGHPIFTGCDASRNPLRGHRHAHIFPESRDVRGRITHITVYAPDGFDDVARRALDGLRRVWGGHGDDLQLVLLGVGQPADFAGLNTTAGQCPLFAESRVWRSRTPFVATRHIKRRSNGEAKLDALGLQIGGHEHDLRRLLATRGLYPDSVSPTPATSLGRAIRWLEFRTERNDGAGRRGATAGVGFELRFSEPIAGPLALGFGAHFGLGQFEPSGE